MREACLCMDQLHTSDDAERICSLPLDLHHSPASRSSSQVSVQCSINIIRVIVALLPSLTRGHLLHGLDRLSAHRPARLLSRPPHLPPSRLLAVLPVSYVSYSGDLHPSSSAVTHLPRAIQAERSVVGLDRSRVQPRRSPTPFKPLPASQASLVPNILICPRHLYCRYSSSCGLAPACLLGLFGRGRISILGVIRKAHDRISP